jgi:hypothetical protein
VYRGDSDEKHRDPTLPWDASVTDLLRPQRLQHIKREPARDCYYTAEEAEAGDLLVDDPAEKTTDSEDDPADGWDEPGSNEDEDFDPDVEMEDIDKV